MDERGAAVIVGGTRAIGFEIARHYATAGRSVVLTGRDPAHVKSAVEALPGDVRGAVVDLAKPHSIAAALAEVGLVRYLVLAAIDRDQNTVQDYDIDRALYLATLKLV